MRVLALWAILTLAAPAGAVRPILSPAPPFPEKAAWLNAKPLTLARLRGRRALLVSFLSTTDHHSMRALKFLNGLHERYAFNGLLIIGVHTPEFGFQKNPDAVQKVLRARGVEFPVLLDNERAYWNAYKNEGWPAFFLVDHRGSIIHDRLGAEQFAELEAEIRKALARVPGYSRPKSEPLVTEDPPAADCGQVTKPVVLGTAGKAVIDLDTDPNADRLVIVSVREGEVFKKGAWRIEPDGARMVDRDPEAPGLIRVIYRGADAFAILSPGPRKARLLVRQDELPLHTGNAGQDILFDDDGRSYIEVDAARLYHVARNASDDPHDLALIPYRPGAVVHGYAFADRCQR